MIRYIIIAAAFIITAYNTKAEDEYWGKIPLDPSPRTSSIAFYDDGSFNVSAHDATEHVIDALLFSDDDKATHKPGIRMCRYHSTTGTDNGRIRFCDDMTGITAGDGVTGDERL